MSKEDFNLHKGANYSILTTQDYGEIVFGCPPDIVKEFIKLKRSLPSKYVFPLRTFHNGKNNFDFEFIVYSFLFTRTKGNTVSAFCRPEQEKQFRKILNETLFGPKFAQLLEAQNHKILNGKNIDQKDKKVLKRFLQKEIANNKKLFKLFESLLQKHASETTITKNLKKFFEDNILTGKNWLLKKNIKNLSAKLTKNYILCAQLQKEFELFMLAKEEERDHFISQIIKFHHIDGTGTVHIKGDQDKRKKLKITEIRSGEFVIFEKKVKRSFIDLNSKNSTQIPRVKKFKNPYFGITFLGVGSGFFQNSQNSSVIIWSEGKGILVDVINENYLTSAKYGINDNDVNHVFLTHVHSDHDSGVLGKILNSRRTYLISSRIIYESFLRKAEAIACLTEKAIQKYCVFVEVEPDKKLKIPGFANTFLEFDYSLHSIPTGRFKITCTKGKIQKSISHSGDTKYDFQKINNWYEQGAFTKKRKEKIIGFIWNSDLIVHDVGGGNLHTNYEGLLHLNASIKKKIVLVHQNEKPVKNAELLYALEGNTITIIK